MPLPREETTPPVMKTYRVMGNQYNRPNRDAGSIFADLPSCAQGRRAVRQFVGTDGALGGGGAAGVPLVAGVPGAGVPGAGVPWPGVVGAGVIAGGTDAPPGTGVPAGGTAAAGGGGLSRMEAPTPPVPRFIRASVSDSAMN